MRVKVLLKNGESEDFGCDSLNDYGVGELELIGDDKVIGRILERDIASWYSYDIAKNIEKWQPKFCNRCGAELVGKTCERYNQQTGKPIMHLTCPVNKCHTIGHLSRLSIKALFLNGNPWICKRCGERI